MVIILLLVSLLFYAPSYASDNLKIGVYLSMTGPVAAWGQEEWKGIKVAHEMEPFAKGRKIKLILQDNASHPETAALSVEWLIDRGVKAIIGPVTTTNALAGLALTEKAKIADIIPSANGLHLTDGKKYAARVCFTNDVQANVMAQYIAAKYSTGVVISDISQDYSVDLTRFFVNDFKKLGGKIIKIYRINSNDTDFSAIATEIKQIKPQFIYMTTYYNETALFARSFRELGGKAAIFSGSAAATDSLIKIGGKAVERLTFTDDYDPKIIITKKGKRFAKLFKAKYGRLPDSAEALAADSYLYLVSSIDKAGLDARQLGKTLRNSRFEGVSGIIRIKNGKTDRTVVIRTVKNGKFAPIALFFP